MKPTFFTDSVNTCDCCGKTDLKGTYQVIDENMNDFYYGSTCVKRNLNITQSELTKRINEDLKNRTLSANKEFYSSDIYAEHKTALDADYVWGDDYYNNIVKPASKKADEYKKELKTKYNVTHF